MPVGLFTFVDLYDRALQTASHLLEKGIEFAKDRGIPETDMLDWRLIDDMRPLAFQFMVVINFTRQWPARIAGLRIPEDVGADLDAAGFQGAIRAAREYLATLGPERFDGRDDVPLNFRITEGFEPTMPAGQWLSVFATTNVYFHLSTAYGILRSKGVHIGKADMFANRL